MKRKDDIKLSRLGHGLISEHYMFHTTTIALKSIHEDKNDYHAVL